MKLQAIVDRPNRKDHLADANSKENVSFCQLLRFVPLSQRSVFTCLSSKTSHLDDLLRKNEASLSILNYFKHLCKGHVLLNQEENL